MKIRKPFITYLFCLSMVPSLFATSFFENNPTINTANISDKALKPLFIQERLYQDTIPADYQEFLSVDFVDIQNSSVDKHLEVKGFNKLGGKVFINGKQMRLNQEGEFLSDLHFDSSGTQSVFVMFTTLDDKILNVRKLVKILDKVEDHDNIVKDRQYITYFYNSSLFPSNTSLELKKDLSRADLAYTLFRIKQDVLYDNDSATNNDAIASDVDDSKLYYEAVNYVLAKQIMGLYPDGLFYPNKTVSRLEFIVSIIRALEFDIKTSASILSFTDMQRSHWAYKSLQTAVREGLVSQSKEFNPNGTVSMSDLITVINKVPAIKEYLLTVENIDSNQAYSSELLVSYFNPVFEFIEEQKEAKKNTQKIAVLSPKDTSIFFEKQATINGKIYPPVPFLINTETVTPSILGNFEFTITLNEGINTFNIQAFESSSNISLFNLVSYNDLDNHWIKEKAAQLRYLSILDNQTPSFNPEESINRLSFIHYLQQFQHPSTNINEEVPSTASVTVNMQIEIADVSKNHDLYDNLQSLIQQGVLSLDENGNFHPTKDMKRIEGLTAIVRLMQSQGIKAKRSNKLPFWDMPKSHWGRPYLEFAYAHELVSESNHFYPNKITTKDELIALLSNLPWIREQVEETFNVERKD